MSELKKGVLVFAMFAAPFAIGLGVWQIHRHGYREGWEDGREKMIAIAMEHRRKEMAEIKAKFDEFQKDVTKEVNEQLKMEYTKGRMKGWDDATKGR